MHHRLMRAYSVDLREKIVAAAGRGMSKAEAARTFGVGATSVKRYMKMAEKGESLAPGKAPGRERKLDESGMKLLKEDLHARPTVNRSNNYKTAVDARLEETCVATQDYLYVTLISPAIPITYRTSTNNESMPMRKIRRLGRKMSP
jgi:transposase